MKVEPEEDTKNECEEEDPMKHLTPVQRIYASNRVIFIIIKYFIENAIILFIFFFFHPHIVFGLCWVNNLHTDTILSCQSHYYF